MNRNTVIAVVGAVLLSAGHQVLAQNRTPVIKHEPVTVAIRDQSISIRATVTDDSKVKSVRFYFSTSMDVAPFKLEMQSIGQDLYVCTVPANLLGKAAAMTYYIEAVDSNDLTTETKWHTVSIQAPRSTLETPETKSAGGDSSIWKTTALVGGGIILAGGAAAIIAANRDSDTTSTPPGNTNDYSGIYIGSVNSTTELSGQAPSSITHGTTITIQQNRTVTSSDLHEGQILTATLTGTDFTLIGQVAASNLTGQVNYYGSIENRRINGNIGGSVQASGGTNGTVYGTFYAIKQ